MTSNVQKSSLSDTTPMINYRCELTIKQHPLQLELPNETLKHAEMSIILGAPEVLTIGSTFLKTLGAKKALDIGTYTGLSALAWAFALPEDGQVLTFDISLDNYKKHGLPIIQKSPDALKKIKTIEGPALEFLDELITSGQQNSFDFAFIDADKTNYPNYYERCVQLLRPGGVILVDNALYYEKVIRLEEEDDEKATAIDKTNRMIFADERTLSFLIHCADGLHIAFKK